MHPYAKANFSDQPDPPASPVTRSLVLDAFNGAAIGLAVGCAGTILTVAALILAQSVDMPAIKAFAAPTSLDSQMFSTEALAAGGAR